MQRRRFIFILVICSLYCTGQLAPVANFSVSSDTICAKDTIRFTDLSLNDPIVSQWSLPGAVNIYSTNVNPTFLFPAGGSYTAILTVTNLQGADAMMKVLTVLPGPTVTASASWTFCLKYEPVTLTAKGATTYKWSTGHDDSVIVITHTYLTYSSALVTHTVIGSNYFECTDTAMVTLRVLNPGGIQWTSASGNKIQVFPNPGNGKFKIKMESSSDIVFSVFEQSGKSILNGKRESADQFEIDLGIQPPGIYILMVKRESGVSAVKLVKE